MEDTILFYFIYVFVFWGTDSVMLRAYLCLSPGSAQGTIRMWELNLAWLLRRQAPSPLNHLTSLRADALSGLKQECHVVLVVLVTVRV